MGLDDTVTITPAEANEARNVLLSPTEEPNITGLEDYLPEALEGMVMTKGDTLPLNIMGKKIDFIVDTTTPAGAAIINSETKFRIGPVRKPVEHRSPQDHL